MGLYEWYSFIKWNFVMGVQSLPGSTTENNGSFKHALHLIFICSSENTIYNNKLDCSLNMKSHINQLLKFHFWYQKVDNITNYAFKNYFHKFQVLFKNKFSNFTEIKISKFIPWKKIYIK